MERIDEASGMASEYSRYQHFISESTWSSQEVLAHVRSDVSNLTTAQSVLSGRSTGLLLDESGHKKSGRHSVGVARQYLGHLGKVDNGQVGVYASLINDGVGSLIDERLFLPKSWAGDKRRCQKAGIPPYARKHLNKMELALEMVDSALEAGIDFDWVGGDGLYGHSYDLGKSLDERGVEFLLEVHCDERIYLARPALFVPEAKSGRGRKPTRLKTEEQPIRIDRYAQELDESAWTSLRVRKTTKGWLKADYHAQSCWVWDGKEAQPRERVLLIRRDRDAQGRTIRLKYAFANTPLEQVPIEELAYRQSQRYWIERKFQDAKQELGLSDYQVRKWKAWHHHHAICFMALYFLEAERFDRKLQAPLMSIRDARILVTAHIATTMMQQDPVQAEWIKMQRRHRKREADIQRHYRAP